VLRAEGDLDGARSAFEAACGSTGGTGTAKAWPVTALAWRAWPAMQATGPGQLGCTVPRRRFRTGRAFPGMRWTRASAGTASPKRVRAWAMSRWSVDERIPCNHGLIACLEDFPGVDSSIVFPSSARLRPVNAARTRIRLGAS